MGMGSLQSSPSLEKIPIPAKQYNATYIDQMDVITECTYISIDGMTFIDGKRGQGNYTIPFDNIDQVFFRINTERLIGVVTLRSGETYELILNKNKKAYGRTKYGIFQIKVLDLKKMIITNLPQN